MTPPPTQRWLRFTHQAFDNLQQLLHYHGNALIAQQSTHDLDVRGTQEVPVGPINAAVGQVQGLQLKTGWEIL